jgi:TRAP-type C4-dicarboxylate transport system substrate-binding protein
MSIKLNLAIHVHQNQATWTAYQKWADSLEKVSLGRLKINITHSGMVGIEEWNMLKSGQSDIARVFTMNMVPFPMHTVPALPYILPDSPASLSIIDSLYKKYLYREWQEAKVLWLGMMSLWHLHTANTPVGKLEDFKGLKIQASGLMAELVKVWGGIPVELTAAAGAARHSVQEAQYNALKTGIVDGTIGTFEVVNDFKLTYHWTFSKLSKRQTLQHSKN